MKIWQNSSYSLKEIGARIGRQKKKKKKEKQTKEYAANHNIA